MARLETGPPPVDMDVPPRCIAAGTVLVTDTSDGGGLRTRASQGDPFCPDRATFRRLWQRAQRPARHHPQHPAAQPSNVRGRRGPAVQLDATFAYVSRTAAASILVAGPVLLVAGWICLILNAGRGANDLWAVGHAVLLVAVALWVPNVLVMRDLSPRVGHVLTDPAFWLVLLGSLAIAGQLAIDLVAWALDLDGPDLTRFFATLRERPLLTLTVHTVGPSLLFLGVFIAAVRLATRSRPARGAGIVVAAGIFMVLLGALSTFSYVTLSGYSLVLLGFMALGAAILRGGVSRLTAVDGIEGASP